jgi:tRNA dimethylallyltransferase
MSANKMNQVLVISGPTATGKTALALKLAKKFNGVLISADSRQINIGMDIGTGKDKPKKIPIHLIDIITPNQSFSVAQYQRLVIPLIKKIQSNNKLPIIVGGTGQYIDSIISPNKSTYSIKPNKILRFFLNRFSTFHLQKLYSFLDRRAFDTLNNSEKNNPHRLIRKIEIYFSKKSPMSKGDLEGLITRDGSGVGFDFLHLSLTAPNSFLYSRIDSRVKTRLNQGLLSEIKSLLKKYSWNSPGLNTLSYKEFRPYFYQKSTLLDTISKWTYDEHAYARRQKTWFKKVPNTFFIDITKKNYSQSVIKYVNKFIKK